MFDLDTCNYNKKKVAIYTRVSTEHEEQISAMANQKDWYSAILNIHPEWDVVQMYADEGVTGTAAYKRKAFMEMIRDAYDGKFDMILTREVSRFARNTVDTLNYTRQLKRHMVEVYFISDGIKTFDPDGELRLSIMATLAQDESRKTSVRVKYGQQTSMEKGVIYGSGNVLGYDRDGRDYVVNEDQAQTVRLIYDMYAQGKGLKAIKWELERRGIRTAMGNTEWHISSISRVLKNPLYIGTLTYHRQYTPDFLEQKKVVNHGEIDLLQVKGKHEHIIPDELYQQVQERLEQRRRGWKDTVTESREISTGRKIGDIWAKKLQCECGNRYVRRRWHTRMDGSIEYGYHCYGQVHTGSVRTRSNKGLSVDGICTTPVIPDWRLHMMARAIFRYCLQDAGGVLKMVEMMLMKHLDDKNSADDDAGRIDVLRREISGLQKKLDNCVELLIEGDLSKEEFRKKKEQYEHRIAELNISLQELIKKAEEERRSAENLDKRVRSLIDGLKSELGHIDDEMHEIPDGIIDAFVEKIVVHKDGFDWYLRGCGAEDGGCESTNGNMLLREMTFTKEDAKEYLYAIDNRRRIHRWADINVKIYT